MRGGSIQFVREWHDLLTSLVMQMAYRLYMIWEKVMYSAEQ